MDYATPISEPIVKRFAARHRLEKKDPKRMDLTPPAEPPDGPRIGAMGNSDGDWQP